MNDTEQELVDLYRKLPAEGQNLVLSTAITAVTAQEATLRKMRREAGDLSFSMPGTAPVLGGVNG